MKRLLLVIQAIFAFCSMTTADPGPRLVYQWDYTKFNSISEATLGYSSDGEISSLYIWGSGSEGLSDSLYRFDLSGALDWVSPLPTGDPRNISGVFEYRERTDDTVRFVAIRSGANFQMFGMAVDYCTINSGVGTLKNLFQDSYISNPAVFIDGFNSFVSGKIDQAEEPSNRLKIQARIDLQDFLPGISSSEILGKSFHCNPADSASAITEYAQNFSNYRLSGLLGVLKVEAEDSYFSSQPGTGTRIIRSELSFGPDLDSSIFTFKFESAYIRDFFVLPTQSTSGSDTLIISGFGNVGNSHGDFVARIELVDSTAAIVWSQSVAFSNVYEFAAEKYLVGTIGNQQVQAIDLETGRAGQIFTLPFPFGKAEFLEPYGTPAHRLNLIATAGTTITVYELAELTDASDNLDEVQPGSYSLSQNYPNPFNPTTTISFDLPTASTVRLTILNTLGQQVRELVTGRYSAGSHRIEWDGRDDSGESVASGVYFYSLSADQVEMSKKMVLLK